jgi:hypothetical protein
VLLSLSLGLLDSVPLLIQESAYNSLEFSLKLSYSGVGLSTKYLDFAVTTFNSQRIGPQIGTPSGSTSCFQIFKDTAVLYFEGEGEHI